jgi:hypothetical protein
MENRDFFRLSYLSFSLLLCVSTVRTADPGTLAFVANAGKWIYQTAATVGLTMLGAKTINKGRFTAETFNAFDGSFDVRQEVRKAADAMIHNDSSAYHDRGLESNTSVRPTSVYNQDIPTEEERLRYFKPVAKSVPIAEPQKTTNHIKANAAIKEKEEAQKTKAYREGYEDAWKKQIEHLEDTIVRAVKAGNTDLTIASQKELEKIKGSRLASRGRIEKLDSSERGTLEQKLKEAKEDLANKRNQSKKEYNEESLNRISKESKKNQEIYEENLEKSKQDLFKSYNEVKRLEGELQQFNDGILKRKLTRDGNPFFKEEIEPEIVWKTPATGKEKLSDRRRVDQDPDPRNNGVTEMILPDREDDKEKASHHHIFRNADGHIIECTPEAERLMQQAFREGKHLGQDYFGNHHYVWINPADKAQFWLKVRPNLKLMDGGASPIGRYFIHHPETKFLVKPQGFKKLGKGVKYGLVGIGLLGFELGAQASSNAIERENHQKREAAREQIRKTQEERYKESREGAIAYDQAVIAKAKQIAKSAKVANINKRESLSGLQPAPQKVVIKSAAKAHRAPPSMNTTGGSRPSISSSKPLPSSSGGSRPLPPPTIRSTTVRNDKGGVTTTFSANKTPSAPVLKSTTVRNDKGGVTTRF